MPVLERTMKTMRLADDVVTFSTFRKTMAECFNRNTKTRRPLLITQNGVASKVIIDPRPSWIAANSPPRKRKSAKRMPSASESKGNWAYDSLVQARQTSPQAMR